MPSNEATISSRPTSTARVLLTNRRHQYVRLDLRGLTGMTEVSGFLTQAEATQ